MPAFMKCGDIEGAATDQAHKNWILLQSMSAPIYRSIPMGAKDVQRTQGDTTLGDVLVVRTLDKSSVKIEEACANGTFFKEVEIHFCAQVKNKAEPYLKYKLSNVIITSYSIHANHTGDPLPTEELALNFTKAEWTFITLDPKDGSPKGNVVGKFEVGAHKA